MTLSDVFKKLLGNEEDTSTPDDDMVTKDKYLRSLRREYRLIQEEREKKKLQLMIAAVRKAKMRKHLFGIGDNEMFNQPRLIRPKNKNNGGRSMLSKGHL